MKYAIDTRVSVAKSREEIEAVVAKAGGNRFASLTEPGRAIVSFELSEHGATRRVQFELSLPHRDNFATRKVRSQVVAVPDEQQQRAWEQACRSRWRALALAIKAKMVSVEAGVETFEEAFLAHIMVPTPHGSRRLIEVASKAVQAAYTSGKLPPLLGEGTR